MFTITSHAGYGPMALALKSTGPPSSNGHLCTEPLPALFQKIWLPGWCILGLARAQRITVPESHGMILGKILPFFRMENG